MSLRLAGGIGLFAVILSVLAACAPTPQPSCREPVPPPLVDAFNADQQQMQKSRTLILKYQTSSDQYQTCLVHAMEAYHRDPPLFSKYFGWLHDDHFIADMQVRVHANQQQKEQTVGQFNDAVKAYNDLHPDE